MNLSRSSQDLRLLFIGPFGPSTVAINPGRPFQIVRASIDLGFPSLNHPARVGRSIFDLRPVLRHVLLFAVKVYKIPVGFIFQLKIRINFEIEYLFHINSFSGVSRFCNFIIP